MKTYVITLAKTFPAGHPLAGNLTYFRESFLRELECEEHIIQYCPSWHPRKLHTIRPNVGLWTKRIKEIEAGEACLSVREWSGRPYHSKMVEIARLTAEDGVGMEILMNDIDFEKYPWDKRIFYCVRNLGSDTAIVMIQMLAGGDGLTDENWLHWFEKTLNTKEQDLDLAIIHFTPARYCPPSKI